MDHFLLQLTFTNFSDTPEGFDMNDLKDFSSHQKLLVKVGKSFAERAKQESHSALLGGFFRFWSITHIF